MNEASCVLFLNSSIDNRFTIVTMEEEGKFMHEIKVYSKEKVIAETERPRRKAAAGFTIR